LPISTRRSGVSGGGPKAGLAIMSALGADELRFAVLADDAKKIAKTPGIGAKTAQKIILELKDRLDLEDALERQLGADVLTPEAAAVEEGMLQDAVEALVALGYGSTEALKAVRAVELTEDMDVERLLREALRHII
ncbi:MAG: helix-hairpin-helix domain-containing protein, partial [Lachnospiraceae bacterium]|nr:helix-hairpin-helix domain-containing protein [Lachnospiraceae bacterium]